MTSFCSLFVRFAFFKKIYLVLVIFLSGCSDLFSYTLHKEYLFEVVENDLDGVIVIVEFIPTVFEEGVEDGQRYTVKKGPYKARVFFVSDSVYNKVELKRFYFEQEIGDKFGVFEGFGKENILFNRWFDRYQASYVVEGVDPDYNEMLCGISALLYIDGEVVDDFEVEFVVRTKYIENKVNDLLTNIRGV